MQLTYDQITDEFKQIFIRISISAYLILLAVGYYFSKNVDEIVALVVLFSMHFTINKTVKNLSKQNGCDIKETMLYVFEYKLPNILIVPILLLTGIHFLNNYFLFDRNSIASSVFAFLGSLLVVAIVKYFESRKINKALGHSNKT